MILLTTRNEHHTQIKPVCGYIFLLFGLTERCMEFLDNQCHRMGLKGEIETKQEPLTTSSSRTGDVGLHCYTVSHGSAG